MFSKFNKIDLKKTHKILTISFPLMVCRGIPSSLPREDRLYICIFGCILPDLISRGAISASRKKPVNSTVSYVLSSDRGPARAKLLK